MKNKRMSAVNLVITDALITAISIGIFMLFYFGGISKNNKNVNKTADNTEIKGAVNILDDNKEDTSRNLFSNNTSNFDEFNKSVNNNSNSNRKFVSSVPHEAEAIHNYKRKVTKLHSYKNDNEEFNVNKVELGENENKVTYYLADVYVTNVKYIKTAFAEKSYGKNVKERGDIIAKENNAKLAISGDSYGSNEKGVVIRNGKLYRTECNNSDVGVLYSDGTMVDYSNLTYNSGITIAKKPWQAWNFGPELLDAKGNIVSSFNTTSYVYGDNPRCAFGYVKPGHYKFVVVDGHDIGYSRGVTLTELAQIMKDEGCTSAYNLDGGGTATMVYDGTTINSPSDKREISDIIYLGE